MERMYSCQASAAFGLEGLVSKELKQSGMQNVRADNGCVRFSATGEDLFLCNLRMHYSDRLYIILTTGICKSFEDLFQLVGSVDWPEYFSGNESIDISCKCTRSTLMSTRDCQSQFCSRLKGITPAARTARLAAVPIRIGLRVSFSRI